MDTPENKPSLTIPERPDGLYRGYDVAVSPATFEELRALTRQEIGVNLQINRTAFRNGDNNSLSWGNGPKAVKAVGEESTPQLVRGNDPWNGVPNIDKKARIYNGESPTAAALTFVQNLKATDLHPFDRYLMQNLARNADRGGVGEMNPNRVSLELRDVARERQERAVTELIFRIKKSIEQRLFSNLQSFVDSVMRYGKMPYGKHSFRISLSGTALIERNVWDSKEDGPDCSQDLAQMLRFCWAERVMAWVHFEVETILREQMELIGTIRRSESDRPGSGESQAIRQGELKPRVALERVRDGNMDLMVSFVDGFYKEGCPIRELVITSAKFNEAAPEDDVARSL